MELIVEGTKTMIINKPYMLEKVKENSMIKRELEEVTLPEMKNNNQEKKNPKNKALDGIKKRVYVAEEKTGKLEDMTILTLQIKQRRKELLKNQSI